MSVHEVAVQAILAAYPDAKTAGFMAAMRRLMGGEAPDTVVPDAWLLDPDKMAITAFEVEDSNRLSPGKMQRYTRLFLWLEEFDWDLNLLVCGRWGDDLRPVDLFQYHLRAERLAVKQRQAGK